MYAYFFPAQGRRLRLWEEDALGMPLLRIELPRRVTPRMCRQVERCLARCRVHQLLNAPERWPGSPLPSLNPTGPLWRQKAAQAALCLLEREGIAPERSTVEVCAERFSPEAEAAVLELIPKVRSISLSVPVPEGFVWRLQREFGVSPRTGAGDAALCFSPLQRPRSVPLWGERPRVEGLKLVSPTAAVPEGCPAEALLSALENQGRLGAEEIEIRADFA